MQDDNTVFKVEPLPSRSQERDLNVQMELQVEMNLDMTKMARSGYTIIDVLSDVGGIQSILISGISILIGIFNYNHFDDFVASKLFKSKQSSRGEQKEL